MAKTRHDLYNDRRYRCCCRLCHSSSGSVLIGALQMFTLVGYLLHLTMGIGPPSVYFEMGPRVAGVIVSVLLITLIVLLHIYGVYFRRPVWIIPFMILQILILIGLLVGTMILAVRLGGQVPDPATGSIETGASPDEAVTSTGDPVSTAPITPSADFYWKIGLLAALVVGAFLHLWFFVVALTAYRYVREYRTTPKNPLTQYRVEEHELG